METTIIAILIYLGVLTSGNTYTKSQVKDYEKQYKEQIKEIRQDKDLTDSIVNAYNSYNGEIWVVDNGEQK